MSTRKGTRSAKSGADRESDRPGEAEAETAQSAKDQAGTSGLNPSIVDKSVTFTPVGKQSLYLPQMIATSTKHAATLENPVVTKPLQVNIPSRPQSLRSSQHSSNLRRQKQLEMYIAAEKRRMELDVEEEQLKSALKIFAAKRAREEAIIKKQQEFVEADASDDDDVEILSEHKSEVKSWVDTHFKQPPVKVEMEQNCVTLPFAKPKICSQDKTVVNNDSPDILKTFLARQSVSCKLPTFSGSPQEWPMFISQYENTTSLCGLSPHENMLRLQEALKGKAREAVESILGFPENVDMVIESLKLSFGRDDLIIKSLVSKTKSIPPPKDGKPETIIAFYNAVNNMVCTMKRLKSNGHLSNPCLLDELIQKMPSQMQFHWAMYLLDHKGGSSLETFSVWLKRCATAQSLLPSNLVGTSDKGKKSSTVMNAVEADCGDDPEVKSSKKFLYCPYCEKPKHYLAQCRIFKAISLDDRWKFVKDKRCCFICLREGHNSKSCKDTTKCSGVGCNKKHHSLLHRDIKPAEAAVMNAVATNQALLKILPVTLRSQHGEVKTYALLDEGSTVTLLDEEIATELQLEGPITDFSFRGITAVTAQSRSKLVKFEVLTGENKSSFRLQNVKTIRDLQLPTQIIKMGKNWSHLKNLDIEMYPWATPKLLIGQDHIDLIITREVRQGPKNAPVASRTKLGWVLHGNNHCINKTDVILTCSNDEAADDLHELVKSYFKTESLEFPNKFENVRSREDKLALAMMEETSTRIDDRWMTGLLWRKSEVMLPESRSQAERRLHHIEKKMDRDPVLCTAYCSKIEDHIKKGYIRELSPAEAMVETNKTWYLPHFAVVNPNKPGKIRVVWDAAAKSNGISLNSELMTGPDLYNSLPGVLLKFRQKEIPVSGDIQEMFLQIRIKPEDCQAQRFLWRGEDREHKPKVLELSVMLFGSVCSPAQAQYIKNENAKQMEAEYPKATEAIVKRHYMDDYLDSFDSVEEAAVQVRDVIHVHKSGGFNIRNWISSHPAVFKDIDQDLVSDDMKSIECETPVQYPVERVLGLRWNPNSDSFNFEVKFHRVSAEVLSRERRPTKREVLKVIMSIFDPLGFVSNFHIKGKILLQEIWKSGIGWDDEVGNEQYLTWTSWLDELKTLPELSIPRWYSFPPGSELQLHVFCDASSSAYAAVAYIRSVAKTEVFVSFIMSKTRVAPLKPMTIPRLELLAALMGSKMADFIKHYHDPNITSTVLWSDSQTVLRWIRSDSNRYKTFVAQRVGEIDELTDVSQWRWVPTKDNVADEATRADSEVSMSFTSRWFRGPDFLKLSEEEWPTERVAKSSSEGVDEILEFVALTHVARPCLPDVMKFSSYNKLVRSTAWMMRFISRCKGIHFTSTLTPEEISIAERMWWHEVQNACFPKEMANLSSGQDVSTSSSLRMFCPRLDSDGVMRITSRLKPTAGMKEQLILDRKHPFTKLLAKHYHYICMHVGQETVVNTMRQLYWIPALRQLVKAVQLECNVCKILNAKPLQPKMGLLPEERLTPYVKPFHFTGMDYFGPITVRFGRKYEKRYGVIFCCLTTRAVHLEVAEKLNTDSAIMAIRRLVGLRGKVHTIWSDNGRNLVGANSELKALVKMLDQVKIRDSLAAEPVFRGILWKFNPPSAPNMGGSWERLIQSVKRALRAVLSRQVLQLEALQTLFVEISHTINSRPLTHVSVDPEDPEAITPKDLLSGMRTDIVPSIDDVKVNLKRQWVISQRHADNFWRRWIKEYRPTLLMRHKWFKSGRNLVVGDLVIIVDESLPRNFWPMGRIVNIFPGRDGVVRIVDVKTTSRTYRRPVTRLCLLDVKDS